MEGPFYAEKEGRTSVFPVMAIDLGEGCTYTDASYTLGGIFISGIDPPLNESTDTNYTIRFDTEIWFYKYALSFFSQLVGKYHFVTEEHSEIAFF